MKKLKLNKTTIRTLQSPALRDARGGLINQTGSHPVPVPSPGGGGQPAPTVAWTCAHSCLLCGPF